MAHTKYLLQKCNNYITHAINLNYYEVRMRLIYAFTSFVFEVRVIKYKW